MRQFIACLLLMFISVSPCLEKEPASPLLSQLEKELKDKVVATKIELGGDSHGRETEMYPDGTVRMKYRKITVLRAGQDVFPIGTHLRVAKVDLKDDRIELSLGDVSAHDYAKLKLMLGKGYESSYDLDAVLGVLSRALRLERWERLQFLKAEYPQLKQKLATLEGAFKSSPANVRGRLAAARQVQAVLRQLLENRKSYDSSTATVQDPEADQYGREAADLGKTVEALDQEGKKEHVGEIRQALKSEEAQAEQLKSQLQAKPSSVAEWEGTMDLQKRLYETVTRRQALLKELTQLGEPASTEESAAIQNDVIQGQKIRGALESQRRALDLAELEARYHEMGAKRPQLLDSYTRAFGTPKQATEAARLSGHLQQMYENRLAAQKLGSDRAAGQAASLLKEIQRIKRH